MDGDSENDNEIKVSTSKTGLSYVNLSDSNLTEFPLGTCSKFSQISYLYLNGNDLTELPEDMFKTFRRLCWLDLRSNKLESIPKSIVNLHHLNGLLLEDNQLKTLPIELGSLPKLKQLLYTSNPLEFPDKYILEKGQDEVLSYLRYCWENKNMTNFEQFLQESSLSYENMREEASKKKKKMKVMKKTKLTMSEICDQMKKESDAQCIVDRVTIDKLHDLLDDQDKALQKMKNKEALKEWRQKYTTNNYAIKSFEPPPFGTDKRYSRMISRKELGKPMMEDHFVPTPKTSLDVTDELKEIYEVLENMKSRRITHPDSKTNMSQRMLEINTLKKMQRKLNNMRKVI